MATKYKTNYGGLLLRGNIWHMRFSVKGETVAESTHTSVRRDAERILAKRRSELVEQVVLAGKKPIKLHEGIDKFVKSRAHMPSAQNCEIHIRYFKDAPDHNIDRITDTDLETVLHKKRAEGYKESTLKVSVAYFNAMLKYLDEQGFTVRKKLKTIKHDSGKIRWLTKDELKKLWAELDPSDTKDVVTKAQKQENYDLARLLYETGTRYSEIADMRWNQVDINKGTVLIKRKKGSVDGTLMMTKTMKEIFSRRRLLDAGEVVFATKQRQHNETRWITAAVKRAELDTSQGSVTLHTLRHSRAVHLLQGGMDLVEVKTFLGHRSIQSTMVYVHVVETDVMAKAVRLTDDLETA